MKKPRCPACSQSCDVIRHGFYTTKSGRRRRYRCKKCRSTFCSTANTAYYRLQHRRNTFDEVAALSVEGVSKSAIARVKRIGWNTVARWLERAAAYCKQFNDETIRDLHVLELQADEIRTFLGDKKNAVWIFATLDVWSRLWPSTVVGRRNYRNTYSVFKDIVSRMKQEGFPLIVTDGFDFYEKVVRRLFSVACVYGQVVKTRRNDRVIKVERRQIIGAKWRFEEALLESEDSSSLNTSFIERLNLTIRQATAYLTRRTTCHARRKKQLEDQLEIVRCDYTYKVSPVKNKKHPPDRNSRFRFLSMHTIRQAVLRALTSFHRAGAERVCTKHLSRLNSHGAEPVSTRDDSRERYSFSPAT